MRASPVRRWCHASPLPPWRRAICSLPKQTLKLQPRIREGEYKLPTAINQRNCAFQCPQERKNRLPCLVYRVWFRDRHDRVWFGLLVSLKNPRCERGESICKKEVYTCLPSSIRFRTSTTLSSKEDTISQLWWWCIPSQRENQQKPCLAHLQKTNSFSKL